MSQQDNRSAQIYARITDTIFAVIMGLSFKEYYWLLAPPVPSFKLAVLLLGYSTVVVSRVGYHKSISSKPYRGSKRFLVDLWILYMYFVLTFAPGGRDSPPDTIIVLSAQVGVYVGYLVWDLMKKTEYTDSRSYRMLITIVCFLLTVIILLIFHLPIPFGENTILGGTLHDWLFLMAEYGVTVIFWSLKLTT